MVLELMSGGDLRNFLIRKRAICDMEDDNLYTAVESIEGDLLSKDLLDICRQVAAGLAHLSDFNVSLKLNVAIFKKSFE